MHWQYHADNAATALTTRKAFAEFVRSNCAPEWEWTNAEVVYGELIANVVRHAPGPIAIRLLIDGHGLVTLDVYDTGKPFAIPTSLPPSFSECGRGLYIVSRLCAHLSASRTQTGNRVRAVLRIVAKTSVAHAVDQAR